MDSASPLPCSASPLISPHSFKRTCSPLSLLLSSSCTSPHLPSPLSPHPPPSPFLLNEFASLASLFFLPFLLTSPSVKLLIPYFFSSPPLPRPSSLPISLSSSFSSCATILLFSIPPFLSRFFFFQFSSTLFLLLYSLLLIL